MPGDDFSKMRPSFWLICVVALRIFSFDVHSATSFAAASIDALVVVSVQHHSDALPKLGIKLLQREASDNSLPQQLVIDGVRVGLRLDHKLVESRRALEQAASHQLS